MQLTQRLSSQQKQVQRQTLSQEMIQMLHLFQMPYGEFAAYLETETEKNVLLEVARFDDLGPIPKQASSEAHGDVSDFAKDDANVSLIDHVLDQLKLMQLRPKDYDIAAWLVQFLDDRGFFPDFPTLSQNAQIQFGIADRKVKDLLKIIQTVEPDGVGARSLKECLLIQIEAYNFDHESLREVLTEAVSDHLEDLAAHQFEKVAKALDIPVSGVEPLQDFIKTNLNPNPGASFSGSAGQVVIPSFEATWENGQLRLVNLEKEKGISLQFSQRYLTMLSDPNTDKETLTYLKERYEKAKTLMEKLQRRADSLQRVVIYVLQKQEKFLTSGPSYLTPLLQKEVASHFGLSSATVSRIVSQKYVQTPFGAVSLKDLCPRDHFGKTKTQLTGIVQDLVVKNPGLSDEKLRSKLEAMGFEIARRTIAKYRAAGDLSR